MAKGQGSLSNFFGNQTINVPIYPATFVGKSTTFSSTFSKKGSIEGIKSNKAAFTHYAILTSTYQKKSLVDKEQRLKMMVKVD